MDAARADLARWVAAVQAEVAGLPDVPARHAFETICEFVRHRTA
jgi:heptaprenyl diphosphate synthase